MANIQQYLSTTGHHPDAYPADSVLDILQQREDAIIDSLRAYALGRGLRPMEVVRILVDVGLESAPEPVADTAWSTETTLHNLEDRLNALTQFARTHGFTG